MWALARAAEGTASDSEEAWLHAQALFAGGDAPAAIRELDRLIENAPEDAEWLAPMQERLKRLDAVLAPQGAPSQ